MQTLLKNNSRDNSRYAVPFRQTQQKTSTQRTAINVNDNRFGLQGVDASMPFQTFFLLKADGTSRYASFLSIWVVYRVAIRSPQLGQNSAPWYSEKSMVPSIIRSLYIFTKLLSPTFWYLAIKYLQWAQQTSKMWLPRTFLQWGF